MTDYTVVHNGVATWDRGETITTKDLDGHDIERLLRLGAIAPVAKAPDTAAVRPEGHAEPNVGATGVDWVSIHPDNPVPNPIAIDQPTLPQQGTEPPANTPPEVKDASDELNALTGTPKASRRRE